MLNKIFNRKKVTEKASPKLRDIYMTLFKIKRNHSFVQVKFVGDHAIYQSMILDVDPDERTLTIDELFPKDEGFVGMAGHNVTLTVRDKGVVISFDTEVIQRGESDGASLYVIRLPSEIAKDQRRGAFRIDVENENHIRIKIESPEHCHLLVKVRDLSATGVRLEIEGDQSETLKAGLVLQSCRIKLGDFGELLCNLDVRNLRNSEEPYDHTIVGGKFIDISVDQGRVLEKFIIKEQRRGLRDSSEVAA
ncbi:MAG: flagellar brake protein [Pseudomonadales bacterium]|nr:flagellar brake protein [Pseudomonadales bacterium]